MSGVVYALLGAALAVILAYGSAIGVGIAGRMQPELLQKS